MTDLIKNIKELLPNILADPYGWANTTSIATLVGALKTFSHYYYNTKENLVTDAVFDIIRDVLEKRDSENPYLKEVGAPITKDKVKLPYTMPSLDKIKPTTDTLSKWIQKYKGPYVLSDKLDGVSCLFYKTRNSLKLFTRGDGKEGQDITHLTQYVLKIPKTVLKTIPDETAVRGELIIPKKSFKLIPPEYKNSRNAIAGLVNAKHFSEDIANITEFVAYSVINPRHTQSDQMDMLKKWKFNVVTYNIVDKLTNEQLATLLDDRRKNSAYEIDGIVVVDSSQVYDNPESNPEFGFAFKKVMTDQITEATVVDVLWKVSKHGYIKPRIEIKPVDLLGVTIKYATVFNAKFVVDNKLGPGAVIKLIRSGDVIPYVMEVLKPATSKKPKMPEIPYIWNDTNVDIIVKDIHGAANDEILIRQFVSFFEKLGVKFISEGIVTKIVKAGYTNLMDIIDANLDNLADIDGIGDKLLQKIYTNIDNAFKTTNLETLMAASNVFGRGFGVRKIKPLLVAYPNIMNEKWTKATIIEKLMVVDGFDTKTATQFANNFSKFIKFFEELSEVAEIEHLKTPKAKAKPAAAAAAAAKVQNNVSFKGQTIVFTGFRNKEWETFIEEHEGKVTSAVSKNTTLVVYAVDGPESNKVTKARELKIPMMTIDEFKNKYKL